MTASVDTDPYALDTSRIKEPPKTLREVLRHLGPSLIITANIVGSGELIMTTTLGAQAGFVTLWLILLSCMVKVAVQLEFGKHMLSARGNPRCWRLTGCRGRAFGASPGASGSGSG